MEKKNLKKIGEEVKKLSEEELNEVNGGTFEDLPRMPDSKIDEDLENRA